MGIRDQLTDDDLQLVLEGKVQLFCSELRARIGVDLKTAFLSYGVAEEELGLMQDAPCSGCAGRGVVRERKPEYRRKAEK